MKNIKSKPLLLLVVAGFFSTVLALTGCGGGGSGGPSSDTVTQEDLNEVAVSGSAVKGPLANAAVSVYVIDWQAADLKGRLIAEGTTNANTQIQDVMISTNRSARQVLIEISGGIDLTTGQAPLISPLRTILDLDDLVQGTPVFATPLSTYAVDYIAAEDVADIDTDGDGVIFGSGEINTILREVQTSVKEVFGFGVLPASVNLFKTSPVLSDNNQADSLAYRTASEALAALVVSLSANGADSSDDLIAALAMDIQDGLIDGQAGSAPVPAFANVADVTAIVTQDISMLTIPGTSRPISEINMLMQQELDDLSVVVDIDQAALANTPAPEPAVPGVDTDGDGVVDVLDDCPDDATGSIDSDGDSFCEGNDLFPDNASEWSDTDGDCRVPAGQTLAGASAGNLCGDNSDLCPGAYGYVDNDGDNVCALISPDTFTLLLGADFDDSDNTVTSPCDALDDPAVAAVWAVICGSDNDGDGVPNDTDVFPENPNESADFDGDCGVGPFNGPTDGNGCGDNSDDDIDGDGVPNALDIDDFDNTKGSDCDGDGVTNLEGDYCSLQTIYAGYKNITLGSPFSACNTNFTPTVPPYLAPNTQPESDCQDFIDRNTLEAGIDVVAADFGEFNGDITDQLTGDVAFEIVVNQGSVVNFSYQATWVVDIANQTITATNIICIENPQGIATTVNVCGDTKNPNFVAGNPDGSGTGGVVLPVVIDQVPAGGGNGQIYVGYEVIEVIPGDPSAGYHTFRIDY